MVNVLIRIQAPLLQGPPIQEKFRGGGGIYICKNIIFFFLMLLCAQKKGAFYGIRKALEDVHVQFDLRTLSVDIINIPHEPLRFFFLFVFVVHFFLFE